MKKLFGLIILLASIFSWVSYQGYMKKGNEEIEVLNPDVSINNIKSIVDIEDEINDSYEEMPLGYSDGNIYIIKYDQTNKKVVDNNIFILGNDGSNKESGKRLPDDYLNCELSICGDMIFGNDGYFNWKSEKEYKLVLYEKGTEITKWFSVSGNSDYYLCVRDNSENKKYTLCNVNTNDTYEFQCTYDSESVINGIFYDTISNKFYVTSKNNVVNQIKLDGDNFSLEKYDEIKASNNDNIEQNNDYINNYLKYTYCLEGEAYISHDYKDSININQYNIADKLTEQLNNITLYGYDNLYKEYILIKKSDDKSSNKIYLAKLEKNGFEMLIEIPKLYGDDSKISIHMVDSENILVKEEYHDKENKKFKNRYIVYDLAEYFQDKTNKLTSDSDKLTLKNTYKNINEYNDSNYKNKLNEDEEKKKLQEEEQNKSTIKDNSSKVSADEGKDYRESSTSWRKGNGDWFYYKGENEKAIGWLKTEKGWYYFYTDGTMQKNAIVRWKDKEYVLGPDGLVLNPDSDLEYGSSGYKDKSKEESKTKNNGNVENTNSKSSGIIEKDNKNNSKENVKKLEENVDNSKSVEKGNK
ncbi:cell wall-binding protein [Clostridium sp. C2-6-12]|uniref:cell wall-binding protein n=1 Tax=Clostridium sp. C2-6-12 TaxID=2698832 RepID=UPI00136AC9AA|nr:cell wall-binding protein [Clostridium sp. C2-6-12]